MDTVTLRGDEIDTARRLVTDALAAPALYPKIRSDLMALANKLAGTPASVTLVDDEPDVLEAYVSIARRQMVARGDTTATSRLLALSHRLARD